MVTRDIILVGTSAGGLEALTVFCRGLPADLPAAIFVVMHVPPNPPSILHEILQSRCAWPVLPATDGASIRRGVMTIAVSDQHLLFEGNNLRLARGPRENRARPSVDAMFRSAALNFGSRCIGIVLTGTLDDGTAGLWAIKDRGGIAIVQSPEEAQHSSMPMNALTHVKVDHTVRLDELPALLSELTREPVSDGDGRRAPAADTLAVEDAIAGGKNAIEAGVLSLGTPSMNTCPHCHGTLLEVQQGGPPRFRCHTGHVFSPGSLLVDLDHTIDEGLWNVLRSIDERQLLLEQLIQGSKVAGNEAAAQEYARQSEDARLRGEEIRALLQTPMPPAQSPAMTASG